MDVLIAAPPHVDTFGYSMPPPGLLRLGGALRAAGPRWRVRAEDLAYRLAAGELGGAELADAACARLLGSGAPDVLGLSTMGATLPIALAIAARARADAPAMRIVLGGPGTTGIDAALVERFPCVDAVVRGEGEETFPRYLEALEEGRAPTGIEGLTWRDCTGAAVRERERAPLADLAALPDYAWDLLPTIQAYKALRGDAEGLVALDSGRGCVYDCSFCTIGRFWSRRSRPLPVERMVAEIASLARMPGAKSAYLCHDIFGADREHALAFCAALCASGVGMPWECRARVDHLDDDLIAAMGRAGCYRVLLGIESGEHSVRQAHGKRMAADVDVLHAVRTLSENGITPILSFLLGLPGEDARARERTLALALDASLAAGANLSFHLVNPQPGTALGEAYAARSRPVPGIAPDMALGVGASAAEEALIAAHPELFSSFALMTELPGGEEHLRRLQALATHLPAVLMARPRAFALAGRRLGLSVEATYDAWRASGLDFDAFAESLGDGLLQELLRWERAIGAAGEQAELLRTRFDLPGAAAALRAGRAPTAEEAPAALAVVRGARSVRTLRLSPAAAALVERAAWARASLDPRERDFLAAHGLAGARPRPPTEPRPAGRTTP